LAFDRRPRSTDKAFGKFLLIVATWAATVAAPIGLKPKTHKASAAKRATPKAAAKQASGERKREVSEICRLVARLRVLEAEKAYQAAIAGTDEENETLSCQHDNEQDEIEMDLSRSIPRFQRGERAFGSRSVCARQASGLTGPTR
jgi:hypothetical protein